MLITPEKKILIYETSPYPITIEQRYYAIGSGRDFATALMHVNYTAYLAVELTNELSANCGKGIDTLTF